MDPEAKFSSIFLGKGRDLQDHPGNIYFRFFVEAFREQYELARRDDKRHVITGVIRLLEMDGFEFLKCVEEKKQVKGKGKESFRVEQSWKPAEQHEIYSKVGHVFRSVRKVTYTHARKEATEAAERALRHKEEINKALEIRLKQMNVSKKSKSTETVATQQPSVSETVARLPVANMGHMSTHPLQLNSTMGYSSGSTPNWQRKEDIPRQPTSTALLQLQLDEEYRRRRMVMPYQPVGLAAGRAEHTMIGTTGSRGGAVGTDQESSKNSESQKQEESKSG